MKRMRWVIAALVVGMAACGGDDGEGVGRLVVVVDGEEGARAGFPFTEDGETVAFVDGWTLRFDKYVTSLGEVRVAGADGAEAVADGGVYVVDLRKGAPTLFERDDVGARRWEQVSFAVRAPEAQVVNVNDVASADVQRMVSGGLTYLIEGVATKGDKTVRLSWEVVAPVRNEDCTNGADGTQGVVVPVNSSAEARLTIHVDHAFFDSLGTEESALRFEAIAAAAGEDGVVTWEELASQPLTALKDTAGEPLRDEQGQRIVYDPGAAQLEAATLQAYIKFSMASQAHLNGEGLCTTRPLR